MTENRLSLVFMATSAFAVPALELIAAGQDDLVAVYTQPARPAGRGHKLRKTAVHEAAEKLEIPVETPNSLKGAEVQAAFRSHQADLAIVASYGLLLPEPVLNAPRGGCVNIHASLLPRWRGAAPIQRALLAGDRKTGICLFQMEKGLDTGPVYETGVLDIAPNDTGGSLHDKLADLAAVMIPAFIEAFRGGRLVAQPQPDTGACYAHKIDKGEARLSFECSAQQIERMLRAFDPWPGSWCELAGERLRLFDGHVVDNHGAPGELVALPLTIACGERAIEIGRIQRAGGKPMTAADMQRGFPVPLGTFLS